MALLGISSSCRIRKSYKLVVTDLESIASNDAAKGVLKQLKDKHFVSFIAFPQDMLNALQLVSNKLQKTSGVLIGKKQLFANPRENIVSRKEKQAVEEITQYQISECKSSDEEEWKRCGNLMSYESSAQVRLGSIQFEDNPRRRFKPLSEVRAGFIDKLVQQLDAYFPLSYLAKFDAFHPKNLPSDDQNVPLTDSVQASASLAANFRMPIEETIDDWVKTLTTIIKFP